MKTSSLEMLSLRETIIQGRYRSLKQWQELLGLIRLLISLAGVKLAYTAVANLTLTQVFS